MDHDKGRLDREQERPAAMNEPMSGAPRPPDPHDRDTRPNTPPHNPTVDPAGAAREIPATSGGELTDPDLAELPDRAAPSIAASGFEIDLDTEPTNPGSDPDS